MNLFVWFKLERTPNDDIHRPSGYTIQVSLVWVGVGFDQYQVFILIPIPMGGWETPKITIKLHSVELS